MVNIWPISTVADIHDVDTTTVDTKRGPKLQAHRRVNKFLQEAAPRFSKALQL